MVGERLDNEERDWSEEGKKKKIKIKSPPSRRRRGASEMRKEREKREAEKNKKRKKKKKRGLLARTIGSLAGCTRARSYVSRLACGLEKRQQNGRSGGRWESGGMRLELEVRKDEGREDVGLDIENGKMEKRR